MSYVLEQLFGSISRAKLLKVFFRNSDSFFSLEELKKHTKLNTLRLKQDLKDLLKAGIIRKAIKTEYIQSLRNRKRKAQKIDIFSANPECELYFELKGLIMKLSPGANKKLGESIKRLGNIRLALLSGFFINNHLSRVDLLIVGDALKEKRIGAFLSKVELETGKTLRYVVMSTAEFQYRMGMFDRFLRDILESQHEKLINRLKI